MHELAFSDFLFSFKYYYFLFCRLSLDVSVGFRSDSYIKYKPLTQIKVIADIQMDFRPISRSGVLVSNKASGRKGNNDYIFIVLRRGYVIFRYVTELIRYSAVNLSSSFSFEGSLCIAQSRN